MIDVFASTTIALIVVMTLVIYCSNRRQARILKEMHIVLEDWYQAKMRDRRETFRKKFNIADGLKWLSGQVNLNIIEQGRELKNPRAAEFFTTDGVRLVISPLRIRKLKSELKASEGKLRKVAKLIEPLLGYKPRKVQVIERSTRTAHEWFDLEIETALAELKFNWGELDSLYFYIIPQEPEKQRFSQFHAALEKITQEIRRKTRESIAWFKQRLLKVSG